MAKETINTAVIYFLFALVVVLMIGGMIIFWPLTVGVALIYLFTHGPLKPKGKWQRIADASRMAKTVELDPVTAIPLPKVQIIPVTTEPDADIPNGSDAEEIDDDKEVEPEPNKTPTTSAKSGAFLFLLVVVIVVCFSALSSGPSKPSRPSFTPPASMPVPGVWIESHYRNGVLVPGHYRSHADNLPANNWSSKGNVNPVTGEPGYRTP